MKTALSRFYFFVGKLSLRQKIAIITLILLLLSIPLAVFIAGQNQDNRQRASEGKSETIPSSLVTGSVSLPMNDIKIEDGKLKIFDEWVYTKTAWTTIAFGTTGAYGYTPCTGSEPKPGYGILRDTNVPLDPLDPNGPKIKNVDPQCMFYGKENKQEYLQHAKLLKQRGFNVVRVSAYWEYFDSIGDGTVNDKTALNNMKEFLDAIKSEGMYISLQIMIYPMGGGGVPQVFFDSAVHSNVVPNPQAKGFAMIDQNVSQNNKKPNFTAGLHDWTDCEYRTLDPHISINNYQAGPNEDNPHAPQGWDHKAGNWTDRVNCNQYVKVPSRNNIYYQDTTKKFIKNLLIELGPSYVNSILWYETSAEPQYMNSAYLDFSDNAKNAFSAYINLLENKNEARIQGCLAFPSQATVWIMDNPSKRYILCSDINYQLTNKDSLWNKFRGKALGEYTSMEAQAYRDGVKDVLGGDIASKTLIAADLLELRGNTDHEPYVEARVLGNTDEYFSNLQGINILQGNIQGNTVTSVINVAKTKKWATSNHMTYYEGGPSYMEINVKEMSGFGIELFNPRGVNNLTGGEIYSAASFLLNSNPPPKNNMGAIYPATYFNSWAVFDQNWNPKPNSSENFFNSFMTKGSDGRFLPKQIIDSYPNPDNWTSPITTPELIVPKLKSFEINKDSNGYFFRVKAIDNFLLEGYRLYAVESSKFADPNEKVNRNNYIVIDSGPLSIYEQSNPHYFNPIGKNAVTQAVQNLDPNIEYVFQIEITDYAGNSCYLLNNNINQNLQKENLDIPFVLAYQYCATGGEAGIIKTLSLASLGRVSPTPTPTPTSIPSTPTPRPTNTPTPPPTCTTFWVSVPPNITAENVNIAITARINTSSGVVSTGYVAMYLDNNLLSPIYPTSCDATNCHWSINSGTVSSGISQEHSLQYAIADHTAYTGLPDGSRTLCTPVKGFSTFKAPPQPTNTPIPTPLPALPTPTSTIIPTPTYTPVPTQIPPTLTNVPTTPLATNTPVPLIGDADGNNIIDIRDFNIWKDELLEILLTKKSDFYKDGIIDIRDFNKWRDAFLLQ